MTSLRLPLVIGLVALAIAGCGRKGDLDTPSMVGNQGVPNQSQDAEQTAFGRTDTPPPAAPAEDRRFILDGLID